MLSASRITSEDEDRGSVENVSQPHRRSVASVPSKRNNGLRALAKTIYGKRTFLKPVGPCIQALDPSTLTDLTWPSRMITEGKPRPPVRLVVSLITRILCWLNRLHRHLKNAPYLHETHATINALSRGLDSLIVSALITCSLGRAIINVLAIRQQRHDSTRQTLGALHSHKAIHSPPTVIIVNDI